MIAETAKVSGVLTTTNLLANYSVREEFYPNLSIWPELIGMSGPPDRCLGDTHCANNDNTLGPTFSSAEETKYSIELYWGPPFLMNVTPRV